MSLQQAASLAPVSLLLRLLLRLRHHDLLDPPLHPHPLAPGELLRLLHHDGRRSREPPGGDRTARAGAGAAAPQLLLRLLLRLLRRLLLRSLRLLHHDPLDPPEAPGRRIEVLPPEVLPRPPDRSPPRVLKAHLFFFEMGPVESSPG